MMKDRRIYRKAEAGSALVYILIAIALLAALTVSFMQPSSQQTSSQSGFRTLTEVKGQADTIRSGIQECVLRYPNGDQTAAIDTSDPGAMKEYPLKPNSTYLENPAANREARGIRCPGANNGGVVDDHKPIFSGSSGKFLPPPPDMFSEWQYYNGADGVFFWIATDKSDSFLKTSMEKLEENFGDCEADVLDNTASAGAMNLDVAGTVQCAGRNLCLRIWMVRKTACP
ncbi:MAG TPA: hypothetical protein PLO23_09775 [Alphaproteobacteria bacterium]|nr:hypothetical protein [Alphaproteobacteria bacterium]